MPENIPVRMIRPHLRDIPQVPMPPGFRVRGMTHADITLWTEIERDAEPFLTIGDDLFMKEFGDDLPAIAERCYLIETDGGYAVSTISAWYNRPETNLAPGRIHWVATRPAYQRRGLARAGLSYAMNRLAQWHDRAMLGTSTGRLGAIQLYLDFGFFPDLSADRATEAWTQVRDSLNAPDAASER
jgi:GNAT superfamily N-acetyltransferase